MTYTSNQVSRRTVPVLRTVDVAGVEWPLYKLEAVAIGLVVFVATLALVGSLQAAVLGGAAVAIAAWWTLRLTEVHPARTGSPRQAAGPQ
ncbi:hypothetical protein HQP42_13065 [Rhodococcus fascians]|uniref:hypothetical protein n=1 Tax=Nocardiaceae TaxID=85025 RepID=UPI001C9091C9|nr:MULTISPECIES: hypothetical protein [Rhodococcus]MBY3793318.1 hypothetical protein [Rhodococcus fascians]MBY3826075.1 hypothetical protein [Rhodococcus fascians]MBY3836537.1 hypothetical protein [Rhodococcus fascians]MBY3866055.1 hypothetical protein [Rhodococcus fascians]MBY3885219.1 hypothetical protein [Rhodococcus fascians]